MATAAGRRAAPQEDLSSRTARRSSPGSASMFDPQLMSGHRILVTGGGTGLGQAMAERFLGLGADVAICGRRKQVCDATAEAWRAKFPKARIDTFGVDI